MPMACGSPWARDQTHTTAVTQAMGRSCILLFSCMISWDFIFLLYDQPSPQFLQETYDHDLHNSLNWVKKFKYSDEFFTLSVNQEPETRWPSQYGLLLFYFIFQYSLLLKI